jgi:membrane-associated HD superfamily phosphohydrolase
MEIVAKRIYREIENILIRNNKVPNNVNQKANNIFKCVQALKSYCQQHSDLHYNLIVEYYETPFTINRDQKLKQFADKYSINISHVYQKSGKINSKRLQNNVFWHIIVEK